MSIHEVSNDGHAMPATGSASGPAATEDAPAPVENIQTGAAPQPAQPTKTFFGLAQDSRRQGFSRPAFDDDYVERFPEDPYGHETAPNAKIWRVYVAEAAAYDENMVGQSRDGLDVMLVFAGLFSAVVTSFLVQVSQNLQADFSEMSALLLHDLLIVQLSVADGATVNVTTPSVDPAAKFEPDTIDVWINGLWVVSLVTSLVVALSAVLVKQWLHRYMTFPSGTPGLRSHIRHFRFMGLEKWRVRIIIGMLPIIMHISLMLFFGGLALFYIPLRALLAWVVGTITALACVLYLVSNAIPIIFPDCPYQTPLTDFIHHFCQVVPFAICRIRHYCVFAYRGIRQQCVPLQQRSSPASVLESAQSDLKLLTQLEYDAVGAAHANLSVDGLDWLYHMSSNPTVHTLVLQAISGLPSESRSYAVAKWSGATDMQSQRHQLVREAVQNDNFLNQPFVERLFRSSLFLPMFREEVSLKRILNEKSGEWDPHIEGAMRLAYEDLLFYMGAIDFFISHSEVLMHPLLWEEIINIVLRRQWNEYKLAQFLSTIICSPLANSPSVLLMTGPQVVWTRQYWDVILKMNLLAPYDTVHSGPMSSYRRTLIAAGMLALSNIRQYRHDVDNLTVALQHLELLACVVRLIAGPNVVPNPDYWSEDFDFLISVLQEFQDGSFLPMESSSPLSLCLADIRLFYIECTHMFEFHFPGLDCFLQTWTGLYNTILYDSVYKWYRPSDLKMPMTVMARALACGHQEPYKIFMSRGWMGILFSEWAICGDNTTASQVIRRYIRGFHTQTSIVDCREFWEYLHQPQQLMLASMLLIATSQHVDQLVKIRPTHTSWSDCVTALEAIRKWGQTLPDPEISLFPWPPSLQNLKNTEAFRKYPLVEWTARRFAETYRQKSLEVALKTLHEVLDDAENVDRVLIPDLEKPDEGCPPPTLVVSDVAHGNVISEID